MNKITSPLQLGAKGVAVTDLQDVLQLCLNKAVILSSDTAGRKKLSATLKRESTEKIYGETTRELIGIFQKKREFEQSGAVDEPTR